MPVQPGTPPDMRERLPAGHPVWLVIEAVRQLREILHDPVLRDRGMLATLGEGDRACTVLGSPLHLADSPTPPAWPAPLLGEHTAEVLRDRLNLSDDEIGHLARRGRDLSEVLSGNRRIRSLTNSPRLRQFLASEGTAFPGV